MKKVSVIIPCYNSAQHIKETITELLTLYATINGKGYECEYVMVNDGSSDTTIQYLQDFKNQLPPKAITIVDLTGNFGSYNALLAGCHYATGDCYIQLHDDLQDPPEYIPAMLDYWAQGWKFVIGQRVKRDEGILHQLTARLYHKLMQVYALPHIPSGGYDLILFDKDLRDHIIKMNESNTNLVYLISWLQYPYVTIPVTRHKTKSSSRWNFVKRVKLVIDSFVSFSYFPIRLISIFTVLSYVILIGLTAYLLYTHKGLLYWFISLTETMLITGISIVAEYLYRTLHVARNRPPFIVKDVR